MTAVRETIWLAIDDTMTADVAEYQRMPSGDPKSFPARHGLDSGQSTVDREAQNSRYSMDVTIDGYVQGQGGAATHAALNELHADTVRRMMALIDVVPGIETIEEGDMRPGVAALAAIRSMAFSQDFTVIFTTRRGDPSTPA